MELGRYGLLDWFQKIQPIGGPIIKIGTGTANWGLKYV